MTDINMGDVVVILFQKGRPPGIRAYSAAEAMARVKAASETGLYDKIVQAVPFQINTPNPVTVA